MGTYYDENLIETMAAFSKRDSDERAEFVSTFVMYFKESRGIAADDNALDAYEEIYNSYADPKSRELEPDGLSRLVDQIYTKVTSREAARMPPAPRHIWNPPTPPPPLPLPLLHTYSPALITTPHRPTTQSPYRSSA